MIEIERLYKNRIYVLGFCISLGLEMEDSKGILTLVSFQFGMFQFLAFMNEGRAQSWAMPTIL